MGVNGRDRCNLYEAIAESWNAAKISYVVMHGIERYPDYCGRDLDVLVAKAEQRRALTIAAEVARREGYLVGFPHPVWGPRMVAFKRMDLANVSVEIHLLSSLQWRGCVLVKEPNPQDRVGPFFVDPWASWAKSVLMYILEGNFEKAMLEHKSFIKQEKWIPEVISAFTSRVGSAAARQLWDSLSKSDLEALKSMRKRIKSALLTQAILKHPASVAAGHVYSVFRRLVATFHPSAPIVAVVGPNGSGKTTVLEKCFPEGTSIFTRKVIRRYRPGILPTLPGSLGRRLVAENPDEPVGLRCISELRDWLLMTYYTLDYFLGYWLRDRVEAGKQRLVLYERHAIDMMVDPVRYGLRSSRWARRMIRLIPRPHLIVALVADPKVIRYQRAELLEDKIAAQNAAWVELYRKGYLDAVLDATRPPEEVVAEFSSLVLHKLISIIDNSGRKQD